MSKEKRILEECFENILHTMLCTTRTEFQNVLVGTNKEQYNDKLNLLLCDTVLDLTMEEFKSKIYRVKINVVLFKKLYYNRLDDEFIEMLLGFMSKI